MQNRARDNFRSDILTAAIQTVVDPGASATIWTITAAGDLWAGVTNAGDMRREIERLRAMERAFDRYQESVGLLGERLSDLQAMHNLPTDTEHQRELAKVVGYFPLQNRITLNRGSRHGLAEHMAVMTPDGLVGWIDKVGANRSQVLLLSSPALKIAAKVLADAPVPGFVRGETADRLVMVVVVDADEVHAGDLVVTSGYSETIPEGLPIGTVIDVHKDRQFGTWRVLVLPHVGTGTFNEVYVLK